jgi:hypothetical protein
MSFNFPVFIYCRAEPVSLRRYILNRMDTGLPASIAAGRVFPDDRAVLKIPAPLDRALPELGAPATAPLI